MRKYSPGKRNLKAKNRVAKINRKSGNEKGKLPHKMRHQPEWMIRENFD